MREPPPIADASIAAAVQTHYGLALNGLAFLPLGNDSSSYVYRAEAGDGRNYLLKLRANGGFSLVSLLVPRFLHERGVPHMVAPLPTAGQALWVPLGEYALSLLPWVEGRTAAASGLSAQQWHELGATTRQMHECVPSPELQRLLRQETFIPSRRHVLNQLEPLFAKDEPADPVQHTLGQFWRAHQAEIHTVIERADQLGAQLRGEGLPLVLCHADLHSWNVLLDTAGQCWIVDWDETLLAPKERDLMFVVGGIGHGLVQPHETTSFLAGYGEAAINQRALRYYRYAWAVQDMGAYAEEALFMPDRSEEARHDAVRGFADLFAPGNIVDIARESE
ncbi:MAG: phosphotransferase [Chloroflexaceae bacterium]|jgi:spectinomycin phosphotransferase|nr:phosphotransferase [Chloroflexaceae bacterium]